MTGRASTRRHARALRRRPEAAGAGDRAFARLCGALWREPLVHFLLLAALLFGAYALVAPSGEDTIVVDQATIDRLVEEREVLLARPLSKEERRAAIATLIDDEVLLREAWRRGLDQDAVVRRHLVQKMRFILAEDQAEPSEAELRAFLESNRERYRTPPTITLEQVFYADRATAPADLLDRLQAGADPDDLGERLDTLGATPTRYSLRDLIGLMGPEAARRIFELPVGDWDGPMPADNGVHFVRVLDQHPSAMPRFEELAGYLRQDWFLARQEEAVAAQLLELRSNYRIVVEDGAGAP
ncbi:MAG: peptidyl-prolyl cis-trans isomerase [Geminicoccaceae bacterium]